MAAVEMVDVYSAEYGGCKLRRQLKAELGEEPLPLRRNSPIPSLRIPYLSMPFSPPSPTYYNLINLLHPSFSLPQILELDILPSSYPSTLYSSPPSLALPKPLLASLFVTAHAEFFTYVASQNVEDEGTQKRPEDGGFPADESCESGDGSRYNAALSATRVLLLWDPNHITAANFRKRHLLSRSQFKAASISNLQSTPHHSAPPAASFLSILRSELSFLTSLVTSPLPKAPKASTLWAHRLWLVRSFHTDVLVLFQLEQVNWRELEVDSPSKWVEEGTNGNSKDEAAILENKALQKGELASSSPNSALQHLYTTELQIVMRAADRHPRNFYAWGYARALFTYLTTPSSTKYSTPASAILSLSLALSVLPSTHSWCMTHPRDISGWTFLVFLIQRLGLGPEPVGGSFPSDVDMQATASREVKRILSATTEAAEKFQWRGESIRWFLRSVSRGPDEKASALE